MAYIAITSVILTLIVFARYLAFAGGMYWLCWVRKKDAWAHRRINPKFPPRKVLVSEFRWSLATCAIFGVSGAIALWAWHAGYTRVYLDVDQYGWPYFLFSILLLGFAHETYFYWTHRWLHLPAVFRRFHAVHHESTNPSPWASFSFHPVEAVIQAVILPALIFVIPAHPAAILVLLTFMTITGVINHTGYELYPRFFATAPFWRNWISATHHQIHHEKFRGNYGLYVNLWDRWMGTEDPSYVQRFQRTHPVQPESPLPVYD